jgi:4-hydroxybenzoate polyprenyltransferase
VNVVFLTFFYLFRILVGGVACSIPISFWLAMFAFFFFLGLAHLKKKSDFVLEDDGRDEASILVSNFFGVASSYLSVLIFGLYLNDPTVSASFSHPRILWMFIPLILISNMIVWRDCFRNKIRTDPVIYFIRNRGIQVCLLLCLILFGLAL